MITLSTDQTKAVEHDGLFVLTASPGSGKTCVVAHRLARLVKEKRLAGYQGVAALSFTNVAKDSILRQYQEITHEPLSHPHCVSTIDSFLNRVLFCPFAHKVMGDHTKSVTLLDVDSKWLDKQYPQLARWNIKAQNITYDADGSVIAIGDSVIKPESEYTVKGMKAFLKRNNIANQADVNYFCLEVLRQYPAIGRALIRRYPFLIIDEAQDCSRIQMALIDKLHGLGLFEIMLVGDPYQAIYEWRDAEPKLLLAKRTETAWNSLELLETHRFGVNICNCLNQFHLERTITQSPERQEVNDAEVVVAAYDSVEQAVNSFIARAKEKRITIDKDRVAILYGGHASKANLRGTKKLPESIWADRFNKQGGLQSINTLPLYAKIHFLSRRYREANDCITKLFYFQWSGEHLKSKAQLLDHPLSRIENKILLWRCCKELPSLETDIDSWVSAVNRLIADYATQLGCPSTPLIIVKKRGISPIPNLHDHFIKSSTNHEFIGNVTLENVHQIKGRTFDAVLVHIDSGKGNYKLCIRKLKSILTSKDLFSGQYHEDGRCFYVAASRARRLLWIACEDKGISEIFGKS